MHKRVTFFSGFSQHYESIFPFRPATFNFLQSYQTCSEPGILDLGCGTGHYIGKFADSGVKAVGIDLDSQMINYARQQHPNVTFLHQDILDVEQLNWNFSLVFSTGNVIAHFSENQLDRLIKNVHQILTQPGAWIFQVVNWDFILRNKNYEFPVIELEDKAVSFYRKYLDISTSGITFKTALKSGKKVLFNQETTLYPVKAEKYISLHKKAGFRLVGHFSDFNKTPYRADLNKANIMVFKKM